MNEEFQKKFNQISSVLKKYIPDQAVPKITEWIFEYKVKLIITRSRQTKLGDYCYKGPEKGHYITINHDLPPFEFLITLVHEFAHLKTFVKYKYSVLPHGAEWKKEYKECMLPFMQMNIFPPDILHALHKHIHNPSAASCTDVFLQKVLNFYRKTNDAEVMLEYLPERSLFEYRNKVYRKEQKVRKRIMCVCQETKRKYLFQPLVPVSPVI